MKKISITLVCVLLLAVGIFFCSCIGKESLENVAKGLDGYSISMSFSGDRVDGAEEVRFKNRTENALSEIWFNLHANAYREGSLLPVSEDCKDKAYKNGLSYGGITVENAAVNGKTATLTLDDDLMLMKIKLHETLYPDESAEISFNFSVALANVAHRLGYGDNTVNLGNMLPLVCHIENGAFQKYPYYNYGDPFVSPPANFEVTFIAPSKYVVAATGSRTSKSVEGGGVKYSYSAKAVRDFALILSEKYTVMSEKCGETEILYYYFKDSEPTKSLKCAVDAFNTYSTLFGQYPYAELVVAEADFCHGGMEYPQLVTISADLTRENSRTVIAHEVAHQWWYGLIGNNQVKDAWMDEGLSEFSTMLFIKKNPSYGSYEEEIKNAYSSYKLYIDVVKNYKKSVDTSLRPLGGYTSAQEYSHMNYLKGMLLFETLYKTMGEKRFEKALKLYYSENLYKTACPEDMISAFSKAYRSSLESLFKSWIDGTNVI